MLQQSASRSNISVPPLFYLGKFAALTMRHLFSFVSGQVTGSWQCYVLRALIHLSSPYPHTAIRRHLSQLEARLLLSQQTSLVRRRAASATRTQMMSSVIWALFKIQNNKMEASFPKSRFKWNAELKNTEHPIKSFTISSFNLSKLCRGITAFKWWNSHFIMTYNENLLRKNNILDCFFFYRNIFNREVKQNKTAWSYVSNISTQQQGLSCSWWEKTPEAQKRRRLRMDEATQSDFTANLFLLLLITATYEAALSAINANRPG